jgi:hypothetical protein
MQQDMDMHLHPGANSGTNGGGNGGDAFAEFFDIDSMGDSNMGGPGYDMHF